MRHIKLSHPSLPDLTFVGLALLVPFALGKQLLNSDGDLARHLRVGEYILSHGLLRVDVFSFTKGGQPFIGYEWLSEVAYATVYRLGGLPAVAVVCGLLIALTYALLTHWLLAQGVDPLLGYLTGILAAILGSVHWLARPHLFTLLGVSILMSRLEQSDEGAPPWQYVPLFGLWANLHGGFLFGLVVMVIYIGGDLVEAASSTDRPRWLRRARRDATALGMAAVGTLLTPYGLELHRHVLAWFKMSYVIDNTMEYLSPDFHSITGRFVLLVLLMVLAALALSRRRPTFPRLLLILASVGFALIYQRNIPLFGLAALPVLALHLDPEWRGLKDIGGIREAFARESPGRRSGPWSMAVVLVLLLLTLNLSPLSRLGLVPGAFDPSVFPVVATEKARAADLKGRIYNDFIWGGYLLLEWPKQKVFIDGQTDFYGEELTRTHTRIAALYPGWRDLLNKWDISLVMVPGQNVLPHELVREPGWSIWYCDSTAVILQRSPSPRVSSFKADSAERKLSACAPRHEK
jgi:hypothetical protein